MRHIPCVISAKELAHGQKVAMNLCSGITLYFQSHRDTKRNKDLVRVWSPSPSLRNLPHYIEIPAVNTTTRMPLVEIRDPIPGIIHFFYGGLCEETKITTNAGGTFIVTSEKGIRMLPGVSPDAEVFSVEHLQQIVIASVNETPFGVPCAAQLNAMDLLGDIPKGYFFPEKPIIIEGWATTSTAWRFHKAINFSRRKNASSFGYVPFVYPWISPDRETHGWAFSLTKLWEVYGEVRPMNTYRFFDRIVHRVIWNGERHTYHYNCPGVSNKLLKRRLIKYNPCSSRDEEYILYLGRKRLYFFNLDHHEDGQFTYQDTLEIGRDRLNDISKDTAPPCCGCAKQIANIKK